MFLIEPRAFDDPLVIRMVTAVQAEYAVRYGRTDNTPIDAGEFAPPQGLFLVGELDGEPVASGGWRRVDDGVAEIKRMYVAAPARGRGLSRVLLAELEASIERSGHHRIVLMTGWKQPEAVALYESSGYAPTDPFGPYTDEPRLRFYSKTLTGEGDRTPRP